ncbi:MAG: FHA domain-containing protein [Ruminococcus sp.]|nr:FHA domain-containing protein [Ruminococcus sp.]MCD7810770.1 FHA domain-containing protein [Ruminococcus sp.]MCD7890849.1 FHA domain-containing protein [Ruminococcus sp.]
MDSMKLIMCAAAAAALDICALVMILSAYREKKLGKRRWNKISGCMELVEPGITYPLEGDEILIGRHASADIRIPDLSVSRYHAVLTVTNGVWSICDIGSKSGVYVNGNLVKQARLHENDVIKLGNHRLQIRRRRETDV